MTVNFQLNLSSILLTGMGVLYDFVNNMLGKIIPKMFNFLLLFSSTKFLSLRSDQYHFFYPGIGNR